MSQTRLQQFVLDYQLGRFAIVNEAVIPELDQRMGEVFLNGFQILRKGIENALSKALEKEGGHEDQVRFIQN